MTRSILRLVLITLALVMLFAGPLNLNRTSANQGGPGTSFCMTYCPCEGGPIICCAVVLPDGTQIFCGMREREPS